MADKEETRLAKAQREDAARARADRERALTEELKGLQANAKSPNEETAKRAEDRIAAVKADLARVKKSPTGRQAPQGSDA